MPGPAHYNHVYTNDNFNRPPNDGYSFPAAQRDIDKRRNSDREPPGPGNYDPKLPQSGTAKSFLGGAERKADKPSGVPSPGKHSPKYPQETPSWTIGPRPDPESGEKPRQAKVVKEDPFANPGPGSYFPSA